MAEEINNVKDTENKIKLGKNLRFFRKAAGFTQERLAEELGITPQAVSRWERGASLPDLETLAALVRILDVSADKLMGLTRDAKLPGEYDDGDISQDFGRHAGMREWDRSLIDGLRHKLRGKSADNKTRQQLIKALIFSDETGEQRRIDLDDAARECIQIIEHHSDKDVAHGVVTDAKFMLQMALCKNGRDTTCGHDVWSMSRFMGEAGAWYDSADAFYMDSINQEDRHIAMLNAAATGFDLLMSALYSLALEQDDKGDTEYARLCGMTNEGFSREDRRFFAQTADAIGKLFFDGPISPRREEDLCGMLHSIMKVKNRYLDENTGLRHVTLALAGDSLLARNNRSRNVYHYNGIGYTCLIKENDIDKEPLGEEPSALIRRFYCGAFTPGKMGPAETCYMNRFGDDPASASDTEGMTQAYKALVEDIERRTASLTALME